MRADDVMDTLTLALEASGCDRAEVGHKPRLLSDNGSSYIAGELADWLEEQGIDHVRGAPYHPQTQGKIERWHQTLKNRILLENYYLPGDLKASIGAFVERYNHHRYHESLGNLTPADVYCGRDRAIIERRRKIKKQIAKTTLGAPTPSRLTSTAISQSLRCDISSLGLNHLTMDRTASFLLTDRRLSQRKHSCSGIEVRVPVEQGLRECARGIS